MQRGNYKSRMRLLDALVVSTQIIYAHKYLIHSPLYHQSIHYFWLAFFDLSSDLAGFHISLTFIDLSPLSSSRLIWQAVGPTRPFGNGAALTQTTTQPCQDTNSFQCGHHCRYQ